MATQTLQPLRPVRTRSGGPVEVRYYPEAASQTFKKGEAVYLVSGKVTEFTTSVDNGSTRFLGFAAADATGTTDTPCPVWIANGDTIFRANMYHSTAASAVTAVTDISTSLLPLKILAAQGTGIVAVDKEDTGSKIDCVNIIDIPVGVDKSSGGQILAVGDVYGFVDFIIAAAARTFDQ